MEPSQGLQGYQDGEMNKDKEEWGVKADDVAKPLTHLGEFPICRT